jgi:hypothetical protein
LTGEAEAATFDAPRDAGDFADAAAAPVFGFPLLPFFFDATFALAATPVLDFPAVFEAPPVFDVPDFAEAGRV